MTPPPCLTCLAPHSIPPTLLPQVKSGAWEATKQKVIDAMRDLRSASRQAEPELDAMLFVIAQAKKALKADRNADRYRRSKLANRFVTGGVGRAFSKVLAAGVDICMRNDSQMPHSVDPATDAFDVEKVTSFTAASELGQGLLSAAAAFESSVKSKQASLTKFLKETPGVGGGMMRIDCDVGAIAPALTHLQPLDPSDKGHLPWAVAMRAHSWRHGPSSFPMPGYGCLVQNSSDLCDIALVFLPIASVVNKGVSADDLHSFLETTTGADVFHAKCIVLKAPPKSFFWCPYGWLCLPFALGKLSLHDIVTSAADGVALEPKDYPLGFLTVLTVFSLEAANALPAKVWSSVVYLNAAHMAKNLWTPRALLSKKLTDMMESAAATTS